MLDLFKVSRKMTHTQKLWNATTLTEQFDRTIVGFDLRRPSSRHKLFMTSYDETVRYEDIYETHAAYLSGINLFSDDPFNIPSLTFLDGAEVVAFDLPTELIKLLLTASVSNPLPLPISGVDPRWQFAGFDVVDSFTQTSAFYGVDRTPLELKVLIQENFFEFNEHGLLPEAKLAIKASKYFDEILKEHAPFSPCGIWLRN
jgi:hypothetical protein